MKIEFSALSVQGIGRQNNEDSYLCNEENEVFAVADGMGGAKAGEVASSLVMKVLKENLIDNQNQDLDINDSIVESIKKANLEIFNQGNRDYDQFGMATTIALVKIKDGNLYVANVGDSRIYLVRDNSLYLLSQDHSYVAKLVNEGDITPEEAENHPKRNILLRAVGAEEDVEVYTSSMMALEGDALIICSDGLYTGLGFEDLFDTVKENSTEDACKILVEKAQAQGSKDDATVIVVKLGNEVEN